MRFIRGIQELTLMPTHSVLTIGNFDGVHLGHQKILNRLLHHAKETSGQSLVLTFRPHPRVALSPVLHLPLLTTYDERHELLAHCGVEMTVEEPFGIEFSGISPESFFHDILLKRLQARRIVVGHDFAFGAGREGHLETLRMFCQSSEIGLEVVPPQELDGELISSSLIRQLLLSGLIEKANKMLGREFFYRGSVVRGAGRGRKLGFPTANLRMNPDKLLLPLGVYATWALASGKRFPSITNLGVRPTFEKSLETPILVETHFLDQDLDLYGSEIEVRFFSRIRNERKFTDVSSLTTQIRADIESARNLFSIDENCQPSHT